MIVKTYENQEDWLEDRLGKITGSKLHDIHVKRGNGKKIGFYQLIADRMAIKDETEDGRDRGHDLEELAVDAIEQATGITFNRSLVMWQDDEYPDIAYSPDGFTDDLTATAEAKCLGSARHLEIVITNKLPNDYREQVIQSFIVNDKQKTLYFGSYDPRITAHPIHILTITREELEDEIKEYKDYQVNVLAEVDKLIEELAF